MLAIDVPKSNENGPLVAENIFSHLAGGHGTTTLYQRYWQGKSQLAVSLEIVSIGGYIQFIIRCPKDWRDMVEASVYGQYPDAEITEIDDYVQSVPQRWPHPEYTFFGLEYKLHKHEVYPIRTYLEFEDKLVGEFRDPMAALLESMSKISPGEQIWIQFVLTPINDKWKDAGDKIINKLVSRKEKKKETIFDKILAVPFTVLSTFSDFVFGAAEGGSDKKDEGPPTMMMHMTPGEKDVVAAIERKISKIGFRTKFRIMYIAKNEVYHKARGIGAVIGATKQFNTINLNRFSIQKKIWTIAYYGPVKWRVAQRQNKIMRAYRVRSDSRGAGPGFVLNIEELASLWHFPVILVKAPLVRKTEAKRAEPPFSLPVTRSLPRQAFSASEATVAPPVSLPVESPASTVKKMEEDEEFEEIASAESTVDIEKGPPPNLPIV